MKKEYDFEITEISMLQGIKVITDTKTGVKYLFYGNGFAGGLTPLLDNTGKPQIIKDENKKERV